MSDKTITWRDLLVPTGKGRYKCGDVVKILDVTGDLRFATIKASKIDMKGQIYYEFYDFLALRHQTIVWPLDVNDVEEVEAWLSEPEIKS